ncbi:type VI secretion system membrane subunit TssM, partial [Burkholderia ambifaria]|uniref:type VI secretion system membrane subunit TssM n=1 Tax=Burkholderia ambifaria TaxID=152480 RepID=UPI001E3601CC
MTVIVAAVVIWFAGPLVSFGGLKPLAPIGIRLTLIALVFSAWILWLIDWSTSIVIVALICLAIWHAFPLVTLAGRPLFASTMGRILAIAGVVLVYAACMMVQWWRRMRRHPNQLRRWLRLGKRGVRPVAASRLTAIEDIARAAIAQLKTGRGVRKLVRLFQGQAYLYDLPWYVVLGSKGSGKTTALLNAGLPFPLDAQLQRSLAPDDALALPGWRLTNEAVLIDTAGHYVQHGISRYPLTMEPPDTPNGGKPDNRPTDMSTAREHADAAEWRGFLRLLRRLRPRLPLNGVLLTINVAALTHADLNVRATESRVLRARLEEMQAEFGTGFPVWLIVTKIDRLPGFTDYFASLGEPRRAQIWGVTMPPDPAGRTEAAVRTELNLLATRLADGVSGLLRNETDVDRRCRLAMLPEAFAALVNPLADLIERVFDGVAANGEPTAPHVMFRGVYLTSAGQTGRQVVADRQTLLQRMIGASGAQWNTPRRERGDTSYFLRDLLSGVVFRESNLARPNRNWEHRARLQRWLGHSLAWLIAVGLCANLWNSFIAERASLAALGQKVRTLAAVLVRSDLSTHPERVPMVLGSANELLRDATHLATDANVAFRFGIERLDMIETDSRRAYEVLSAQVVLPRIVHRLEDVIASSAASGDAKAAYDALRVYMMLYDRARFNAHDVKMWVLDDWARHDSAAMFGGRAAMIEHVQRLFSEGHVVQSPSIRNEGLIQQARAYLDGSNPTDRLYQRAKAAMLKDAPDEFSLLRVV